MMAESEKSSSVRLERILLAALDKVEYPAQLLKKNIEAMPDFDFDYSEELEKRKLSAALKSDEVSQITAKISYFQGRVYSTDIPDEERKIWITKAAINLAEGNREYDCLPLTDWKVALPIEEAKFKSQEINLVVKPVDVFLNNDEDSRRLIMVLGVVE